ncbi:prepilin-type N-terminal cleavage/methylation domain-containing protein [Kordiimonas sp.]|uniref:prepilin-type N-terminal cleavage/methylation domain-containing protein n=1 Tax=Kordiimonas sp. TaxID=1970157 RepID=UPI003A8FA931
MNRVLQKDDGFSLVELMVVMAIMGLMAGAVVFMMPSRDTRLEDDLERTKTYLTALSRSAIANGRPLGVRFEERGFTPFVLEGGVWQARPSMVGQGGMWENVSLTSVTVDGQKLGRELRRDAIRPHVWLLPTGEVAAFDITLMVDGRQGHVKSVGNGSFEVSADD